MHFNLRGWLSKIWGLLFDLPNTSLATSAAFIVSLCFKNVQIVDLDIPYCEAKSETRSASETGRLAGRRRRLPRVFVFGLQDRVRIGGQN